MYELDDRKRPWKNKRTVVGNRPTIDLRKALGIKLVLTCTQFCALGALL